MPNTQIPAITQPNAAGPWQEGLLGTTATSSGSPNAGQVPLLNSSGYLDPSLLPPLSSLTPTNLSVTGTGVVTTATTQWAYLDFTFTAPTGLSANNSIVQYQLLSSYVASTGQTVYRTDLFQPTGPFRLQSLVIGQTYTLQLASIDSYGQLSTYTASVQSTTGYDTTPPAAPTITATIVSSGQGCSITVSVLNTEPDFDFYKLLRAEGTANASPVTLTQFKSQSFTDVAIPTTDNYWYTVEAYDLYGNYSTSNQVGPEALIANTSTPPAEPTMSSLAANTDGSVIVTWQTVTGAANYRVWNRVTGTTTWVQVQEVQAGSGSSQSYTDTTPLSGTQYDYTVSALNNENAESTLGSSVLTVTAKDTVTPGTPGTLSFTSAVGSVTASWAPSTTTGAKPLLYGVSYQFTSAGPWSTEVEVPASTVTLYGLTESRDSLQGNLEFRVRALDPYGNASGYSDVVVQYADLIGYAPTNSKVPPAPIFPSQVTKNDGSITIQWPAVSVPDIWGYRIDRRFNEAGVAGEWEELTTVHNNAQSGTLAFTDYGLEPYAYQHSTYDYAIYSLSTSHNISRLNLLSNSSFEAGALYWSGTGTITTAEQHSGTKAAIVSSTATLYQSQPITAGDVYTVSAWFLQNGATAATALLELEWLNASDAQVGTTQSVSVATSASWQRLVVNNLIAPTGATQAQVTLTTTDTTQAYVDDAQLEQAIFPSDYGDGKLLALHAVDNAAPTPSVTLTASGVLGGIKLSWSNGSGVAYINSTWEVWRDTSSAFTGAAKVLEIHGASDGSSLSVVDDYQIVSTVNSTFYYNLKIQDRWKNESAYLLASAVSSTSLTQDNLDQVAPAVPVGLTAGTSTVEAVANGYLSTQPISWTANTETDLNRYEIEYWPGSATTPGSTILIQPANKDSTTITIRGLLPNQAYTYRIRAVDTWSNFSDWSAVVTATTAKNTNAPAVPTLSAISTGLRSLMATISPANSEADFAYYNWYRATSTTFPGAAGLIFSGPQTVVVDTAVVQGTTYYYWAEAVNTSDISSTYQATPLSGTPGQVQTTDITDSAITTPKLEANSVTADKLEILSRGLVTSGIKFTPTVATNTLTWTAGTLVFGATSYSITAGSAAWTSGFLYIYFDSGVSITALQSSTSIPTATTAGVVGTYAGGYLWSPNAGMTLIDGTSIQAGTITAVQLGADTITANQIAVVSRFSVTSGITFTGDSTGLSWTGGTLTAPDSSNFATQYAISGSASPLTAPATGDITYVYFSASASTTALQNATFSSTVAPSLPSDAFPIAIWTGNANVTVLSGQTVIDGGHIQANTITADKIQTVNASSVQGTLATSNIPGLDASKIISGTFALSEIPTLDVAHLPTDIPVSQLDQTNTLWGNPIDATYIEGNTIASGSVTANQLAAIARFSIAKSLTFTGNTVNGLTWTSGWLIVPDPAAGQQTVYGINAQTSALSAPSAGHSLYVYFAANEAGGCATPAAPVLSYTAGGSLAATTYYVRLSYATSGSDSVYGPESSIAVPANNVLVVSAPTGNPAAATDYKVWVGTTANGETLQTSTAITLASNWTEPTSGLVSGAALPGIDFLNVTATDGTVPVLPADAYVIANWRGGTDVTVYSGQTVIDGGHISTGVIQSDSGLTKFDLTGNIIDINDGTRDRVKIGSIGTDYAIQVFRSDGSTVFDTTNLNVYPSSQLPQTLTLTTSTGSQIKNGQPAFTITVSWTLSAAINDLGDFEVQWIPSGGTTYSSLNFGPDATQGIIQGLQENQGYSVQVRAYDKSRQHTAWATATVTTPIYTPSGITTWAASTQLVAIPVPPDPATNPTIPSGINAYAGEAIEKAWDSYTAAMQMQRAQKHQALAVYGLATIEPLFDHFEVEAYNDSGLTSLFTKGSIKGGWNSTNSDWEQNEMYSHDSVVGNTYYLRARVMTTIGRASAWSSTISTTVGSSAGLGATYGSTAFVAGPSQVHCVTTPAYTGNLSHFDWYISTSSTSPSATTRRKLEHPAVTSGTAMTVAWPSKNADTLYFYVRAVDMSGNADAWTSLGSASVENITNGSSQILGPVTLTGTSETAISLAEIHDRTSATIGGHGGTGLDNVTEGTTYNRTLATSLIGGIPRKETMHQFPNARPADTGDRILVNNIVG